MIENIFLAIAEIVIVPLSDADKWTFIERHVDMKFFRKS